MKDWTLVGIIIGYIIILGIGLLEQKYLDDLSYKMVNDVSDIEETVYLGDIKTGVVKLQNIISKWEKGKKVLGIIINHEDIKKISESLIKIDSKLKKFSNSDNVSANFALLKEYIINIKKENEFTISNVL